MQCHSSHAISCGPPYTDGPTRPTAADHRQARNSVLRRACQTAPFCVTPAALAVTLCRWRLQLVSWPVSNRLLHSRIPRHNKPPLESRPLRHTAQLTLLPHSLPASAPQLRIWTRCQNRFSLLHSPSSPQYNAVRACLRLPTWSTATSAGGRTSVWNGGAHVFVLNTLVGDRGALVVMSACMQAEPKPACCPRAAALCVHEANRAKGVQVGCVRLGA